MCSSALVLATLVLAAEPSVAVPAAPAANAEDSPEKATEPPGGAGIAPIEIVPRLELRQTFTRYTNGISSNGLTTEFDIQFFNRVLLRYVAPLLILKTPTGQISGVGDLEVQGIGILQRSPRFFAGLIVGGLFNSASQPELGDGKQQLELGGGVVVKPQPWWMVFSLLQENLSVGGDARRADINQLFWRVSNIVFSKGYTWYRADLDTIVDINAGSGRFFGALEVGSLLIGRVGLFARAGTQLAGQRQVDYSFAGGLRYLFRLEHGRPSSADGPR